MILDESDTSYSCSLGVSWANLPIQHITGDEYIWASEGIAGLLSQGCVEVKEVITDPGSGAGWVGESLFKDSLMVNPTTHSLDTRHLSENIRKSMKRDDKLLQIMTKRIKAETTKILAYFALDEVDRCTVEINQAHALYVGDAAKEKNKLYHTKHALVSCYMGNHNMCKKHSIVCKWASLKTGSIKVHF